MKILFGNKWQARAAAMMAMSFVSAVAASLLPAQPFLAFWFGMLSLLAGMGTLGCIIAAFDEED